LIVSLLIYCGTVLTYHWFTHAPMKQSASCGGGATISNLGFLGVPLLTGVLGAQGAAPIAIVMVVELGIAKRLKI
jgi:predicted permease